MKEKQNYRIYAIIADNKVFVGKTTAQDTKPILWRHLRGDIHRTRKHLKRDISNPQLIVMKEIRTDVYTAYRHTIAFIRLFRDNGYEVLNSPGMVEDALDIHKVTQEILDNLKHTPLPRRLAQSPGCNDVPAPDSAPADNPSPQRRASSQKELATEKLTIHVTPTEKERFLNLAKETGVAQRQCLMLMLENAKTDELFNPDWSANEYVSLMLRLYKEDIAKKEELIHALKEQLEARDKEERKRLSKMDASMRQGLYDYFSYYTSGLQGNKLLEQGLYTDYLADTPQERRHKYPGTEDAFLFFPERIMLGKGRLAPLFIIGRDSFQQKILLRYYPKSHRVGLRFTNETFGLQNSRWLVRCERAKDGAMDVVFALPLDIVPNQHFHDMDEAPADDIESLIHNAESRSKHQDWDFF